jgi:beta-lactam-binding protein with PASTA domain
MEESNMGWKTKLIKGVVSGFVPKEVVDFGTRIGNDLYEQQKTLIKIPDLKDVHIDEALRILKDELHLIPTKAIAHPNIAYADESEYEVMYSKPRFGSRVNPSSAVKVYYLTQEVIDKSKQMLGDVIREFKVPVVIGLNIYEAREDLESLGLKVSEKLEQASPIFVNKEDGQVIRMTHPNGKKIGTRLRTGNRVWIYYVNEEVILQSKAIVYKKQKDKQEIISRIGKTTHGISKGISIGTASFTKSISQNWYGNTFLDKLLS